jgi:hypothetical protein
MFFTVADARKNKKKKRDESTPSFSLGFSDDDEEEPTPIEANCHAPTIIVAGSVGTEEMTQPLNAQCQTMEAHSLENKPHGNTGRMHTSFVHEFPDHSTEPKNDVPTSLVLLHQPTEEISAPTNDATPSENKPARTNDATPSENKPCSSIAISFLTPATKGQSSSCISPATITKCFSETELVNRMDPWDNKINLNCKSLEFEFTDSPVNKKKIASCKLAKSPWSQGLSHPKRDSTLTSTFVNWLVGCRSDELVRYFSFHFSISS